MTEEENYCINKAQYVLVAEIGYALGCNPRDSDASSDQYSIILRTGGRTAMRWIANPLNEKSYGGSNPSQYSIF